MCLYLPVAATTTSIMAKRLNKTRVATNKMTAYSPIVLFDNQHLKRSNQSKMET